MEPSSGIRYNLKSSYYELSDNILNNCPNDAFKRVVYILAFFHAVVQVNSKKYFKEEMVQNLSQSFFLNIVYIRANRY